MSNLIVIEEILGNLIELQRNGQITNQNIDRVTLQWFECDRNILRKTSQHGQEVAFRLLKEGSRLAHDDVVMISDQTAIVIAIEPVQTIVLSPKTLPEMARACYEIGNKHAPLFLEGDEVLLPFDQPMFAWLNAAGFHPSQQLRRLSHALRANSAQGHGHAHHHGHDHHHSHHSHGHQHKDAMIWHKV